MQTFLPSQSFCWSAMVLDDKRLGKQRVEAKQLLQALGAYEPQPLEKPSRWRNHPACRMWRGYENALMLYHDVVIDEWLCRGYKNNMPSLTSVRLLEYTMPPWLGDEEFHASHRSNLLRKDPEFYSQYHWLEPDDLPYVWPV